MRRSPWSTRAALFVPLLVASCDGLPADEEADSPSSAAKTEVVRAAITDPGTRSVPTSQIAMAVTSDRIFAVWQELDANYVRQIVGQEFTYTGQAVTPARFYTNTGPQGGDHKYTPAILDNGSNTFLITWTDNYMNGFTDNDIWGEVVNSLGTPTTPFHINFDSTVSSAATIALVGSQWLVSYADAPSVGSSDVSYKADFVNTNGPVNPGVHTTVFHQAGITVTEPKVAYNTVTGSILVSLNGSKYAFGTASPLQLYSPITIPANGTATDMAVAFNTSTQTSALAWRDQVSGATSVRSMTFSTYCQSQWCADPETSPSPIRQFSGITDVRPPVITPLSSGFAIFASMMPAPGDIDFSWINGQGALGAIASVGTATSCGTTRSGNLSPGNAWRGIWASSKGSGAGKAYVMYDSFCGTGGWVQATGWDLTFSKVQFPISDP
jgi:hypothetical protein